MRGERGMMVGRVNGNIVSSDIKTSWETKRGLDEDMLRLVETLSI
jgi:hypothetical protein